MAQRLQLQMPGKISTKELFARAEANSEELLREVSNFRRNVISQFSILCQTNNLSASALSLQSISVSVFSRPLPQKGLSLRQEIMSVCLSVSLSLCLSVSLFIYLFVRHHFFFLQILNNLMIQTIYFLKASHWQPVPPYSDPVSPITDQNHPVLTQYHQVTTSSALY